MKMRENVLGALGLGGLPRLALSVLPAGLGAGGAPIAVGGRLAIAGVTTAATTAETTTTARPGATGGRVCAGGGGVIGLRLTALRARAVAPGDGAIDRWAAASAAGAGSPGGMIGAIGDAFGVGGRLLADAGDLYVDDAAIDLLLVEELDGVLGIGSGLEVDEPVAERSRAAGDDVGVLDGPGGAEVLAERLRLCLEREISNKHLGGHDDDDDCGEDGKGGEGGSTRAGGIDRSAEGRLGRQRAKGRKDEERKKKGGEKKGTYPHPARRPAPTRKRKDVDSTLPETNPESEWPTLAV